MKTIFRSTIAAFMFAAVIALGAVAGFAQDPCADADGQTALGDKFRALYAKKDVPGRKDAIDTGKQFLEKYGSCDSTKDLSDYLKVQLPKMEIGLANAIKAAGEKDLADKFNNGLKAKNWDDVYAAGKQLLAADPDKYRPAEIVMGSIGLDENFKTPKVTKWNDDTLKYARQSLADLQAGKTFSSYGIAQYEYKSKDDALGWMNYTVGYILASDKNNKKEAVSYLYKASQAASDTKSNPVVFQWIGLYYYDEANKLIAEVKTIASVPPVATDTPEVKQQKLDAIKAKVGLLNGTLERAMDAYSRAYALAPTTPTGKAYRDGLLKTLGELYNVRFEKADGLDAWIKAAPAKPFPDPNSAIAPVIDPEPAAGTAAPTTTPVKPATSATPATKPAANSKPQSVVGDATKVNGAATATTVKPVVKKKSNR